MGGLVQLACLVSWLGPRCIVADVQAGSNNKVVEALAAKGDFDQLATFTQSSGEWGWRSAAFGGSSTCAALSAALSAYLSP